MNVQPSRIKYLNQITALQGEYVLYWMQQSQRAEDNHALAYAASEANKQGRMMIVLFVLTADYPGANLRHYTFMLEGLKETGKTLEKMGIRLVVKIGDPVKEVLETGQKASMIVCDRGYLRHQRSWRQRVAEGAGCPVIQVESDVVIPIEQVSDKAEYAAYTIRPKINRLLERFLVPACPVQVKYSSLEIPMESICLENIDSILKNLNIDKSIPPVSWKFKGGTSVAKNRFDKFLDQQIPEYAGLRNEPVSNQVSGMSPYLHFGQVSPLYLALKIKNLSEAFPESAASYLEELIIRRELAANFVYFSPSYDSPACLPEWAKKSLAEHEKDERGICYSKLQLTACATHDEYWNAAMKEMVVTGYMHNYMRMYWGKKILEWSRTPQTAWETIADLNNTYFLDGRDPNSYAGIGWIFGLHDRAWFERSIFGKVRYMAASGLERKCDIKGYVRRVNSISSGRS